MNLIEKDSIPLENYEKSISNKHEKFLLSTDLRGMSSKQDSSWNPSDIRKGIMKNMGNSMKYIHSVLKHTKNLKESEIYEIFNAVNLKSFFGSLLRSTKLNSRDTLHGYKYDFRTCENARLMLEESLNYIVNSQEFIDRKSTRENCKQIREDFILLSKSQLSKEHQRIAMNLSKEDEEKYLDQHEKIFEESEKIHDKLDEIIIKCPSIRNLPDSIKFSAIGKALERTIDIILLKLTRLNIEPKKTNSKVYKQLIKEVEVIEEGLKLIDKLKDNENKLIVLESNLYKEIQYYFSPINPIRNYTEYEEELSKFNEMMYNEFY